MRQGRSSVVSGLARSFIEARRAIDAGSRVAAPRPDCADTRMTGRPAMAAVRDTKRRREIIVEGYTTLTAEVAERAEDHTYCAAPRLAPGREGTDAVS